jgi:chaperonin GroES
VDLRPLQDRVIIRKKNVEKIGKEGLIYAPTNTREFEPTEGTVVAIGPTCTLVKVDDNVYYGRYTGFQFERNDETFIFCNEEDILAIITPNGGK